MFLSSIGKDTSLTGRTVLWSRAAGIIFVAAAGNEGSNNDSVATYPANYPLDNVVSVAATTRCVLPRLLWKISSEAPPSDRRETRGGCGLTSLVAALFCPASGGARRLEGRPENLTHSHGFPAFKTSSPHDRLPFG